MRIVRFSLDSFSYRMQAQSRWRDELTLYLSFCYKRMRKWERGKRVENMYKGMMIKMDCVFRPWKEVRT